MFSKTPAKMKPVYFGIPYIFVVVSALVACGRKSDRPDSKPMWVVSGTLSENEIAKALKATIAVRINLTSNRATLYQKGEAKKQWNIASADITGRYHGGEPKFTPSGIYGVEDFEHCPVWRPRDPVNPATGRVAQTEDERWQIFSSYPDVYGPCGVNNPLGRYVFWFQGPFGLHGNAAEYILRLPDPDDRRVSGGCLRSPNSEIKSLFHLALETFGELAGYRERVRLMEESPNKQTISQSVRSLDMRVLVGHWHSDPSVVDSNTGRDPSAPTPAPVPSPAPVPIPQPAGPAMICKAIAVDLSSGVAPVHRTLPATNDNISAYYRLNDPVRVHGKIPDTSFYRTGRGYIDEKYIGKCAEL
jgi:hypothetical protein